MSAGAATANPPADGDPLSVSLGEAPTAAAAAWSDLDARLPGAGVTCSWAWTSTWLEHYGDLVPHRFVVVRRGGVPCGIALLTEGVGRRRGPARLRTLHLGTAGEPPGEGVEAPCRRLLALPGERMTLAGAVAGACHADRSWDVLELQCLDPLDAAALAAAGTGLRPAVRGEPSPFADLAAARATGVPVLETLRSGTRARVRRSLRGFGALDTELAADPDQALDIFDELVDLHQASWLRRGEPGAFASERFHGFHRRLVPRLLERGELVLFRVRRAAGTVGCVYGFVDRNRMLMYQTGLATVREPRLKPGFVAHALCMEACLERGLDAYDLLPEDDQYKRQLSTSAAELMWLRAERSRVRLWPWNALRRTRRWARRRWAR